MPRFLILSKSYVQPDGTDGASLLEPGTEIEHSDPTPGSTLAPLDAPAAMAKARFETTKSAGVLKLEERNARRAVAKLSSSVRARYAESERLLAAARAEVEAERK